MGQNIELILFKGGENSKADGIDGDTGRNAAGSANFAGDEFLTLKCW